MTTAQEFYAQRNGKPWEPPKTAAWGHVTTKKKRTGPGPEAQIQKAIMEYLTAKGIFHFKVNTTGIYKKSTGSYIPSGSVGCPDIICIVPNPKYGIGRFIGIEVKAPNGKVSESQKKFGANIEASGGMYIVARSIDDVLHTIV